MSSQQRAPRTSAAHRDEEELSPAERYARAKVRAAHPHTNTFADQLEFGLDPFQRAACERFEAGNSVLVAAPTGAGKTIIAEFAIWHAMTVTHSKVFYTAPIKALSNQKYQQFVAEYGADAVGLLTGDTVLNPEGRIVVMTTEVLRNMIYARSALLDGLGCVILDEVHYLADRFRGAVWEEIILHLSERVPLVSLSATVSNAEEFGDWLHTVRGNTDVIVSEHRPVPLSQHVLTRDGLLPLLTQTAKGRTEVNPELLHLQSTTLARSGRNGRGGGVGGNSAERGNRAGRGRRGYGHAGQRSAREQPIRRYEIIDALWSARMLPAIFFLFSRNGCEQAVDQLMQAGICLTTEAEAAEIRAFVEDRASEIPVADRGVLGYWQWLEALEAGIAAHHAGMLPLMKEIVEQLFVRRLVQVVFATETLALGINMPAKAVVIEKLIKFNGEANVPITPGEYTQLTGRAGRRGIDAEGHAVLVWSEHFDVAEAAALASKRSYPMNSSFRPTYNMAVHLIDRYGRARTRELLERSFAQFQADRAVRSLQRELRAIQESLAGYERSMTCTRGDIRSYLRLREELTALERSGSRPSATPARDQADRAAAIQRLRMQLRQHPTHRCPDRDRHARWSERWVGLERQQRDVERRISRRTGAVATLFDRVTEVLHALGYVELPIAGAAELPDAPLERITAQAETLKRVYGSFDLLVSECVRYELWAGLDAPGLAALCTAFTYEPRRSQPPHESMLPTASVREAMLRTLHVWETLEQLERAHRLPGTPQPELGLCRGMYAWALGAPLPDVLYEADLSAGDFVRVSRQTIDLLEQIRAATAGTPLAALAHDATALIDTGIIAYSAVKSEQEA